MQFVTCLRSCTFTPTFATYRLPFVYRYTRRSAAVTVGLVCRLTQRNTHHTVTLLLHYRIYVHRVVTVCPFLRAHTHSCTGCGFCGSTRTTYAVALPHGSRFCQLHGYTHAVAAFLRFAAYVYTPHYTARCYAPRTLRLVTALRLRTRAVCLCCWLRLPHRLRSVCTRLPRVYAVLVGYAVPTPLDCGYCRLFTPRTTTRFVRLRLRILDAVGLYRTGFYTPFYTVARLHTPCLPFSSRLPFSSARFTVGLPRSAVTTTFRVLYTFPLHRRLCRCCWFPVRTGLRAYTAVLRFCVHGSFFYLPYRAGSTFFTGWLLHGYLFVCRLRFTAVRGSFSTRSRTFGLRFARSHTVPTCCGLLPTGSARFATVLVHGLPVHLALPRHPIMPGSVPPDYCCGSVTPATVILPAVGYHAVLALHLPAAGFYTRATPHTTRFTFTQHGYIPHTPFYAVGFCGHRYLVAFTLPALRSALPAWLVILHGTVPVARILRLRCLLYVVRLRVAVRLSTHRGYARVVTFPVTIRSAFYARVHYVCLRYGCRSPPAAHRAY